MLIFDIETAPLPDAEQYIEIGDPPANYKNPDAIERWREEERRKQLAKAALDVDLCRVVAIVGTDGEQTETMLDMGGKEDAMLQWFWAALQPPIIGFNCLAFDLPVLCRRSLYLGLKPLSIKRDKYRHDDVIDLLDILTEQGRLRARSLDFYCRRFGIDIPAEGDGADVPGWVAAGDWSKVEAHCRVDVARTAALAKRIGVL